MPSESTESRLMLPRGLAIRRPSLRHANPRRQLRSNHKTLHDLTEEGVGFVVRIKQATHLEILGEIAVSEEGKRSGSSPCCYSGRPVGVRPSG